MPKNKWNVSLEIFKTNVWFLSMTIQLGVASNHINKHINKEWFKKSEGGPYKLWNVCLLWNINITISPLHIQKRRLWIAFIIFRSSISFPRVDGFFSTAARLLRLSWAFSYIITELQNYSLCESLIKPNGATKSTKSTITTSKLL